MHLYSLCWATGNLNTWFICIRVLKIYILPLGMMILSKLSVDHTKAERYVRLRVVFLHLVFELLMKSHASIAYQYVVKLLKVEVDVIMMVRVMPLMLL